ncbi:hypothetical protein WOLCODRAFT_160096 [Wolfiporia cocos MD-104 SS10]|uniref:Uncharacterized protein n=1 Tax=Wolfiporia cocos (strain MD-104) TaxID=742152 RepID=A0A2H3J411_WOLCO|nr:hypothetical protein WOLCODRAFT_160096 [Wolfiporia cocos MD-104 SS10]
MRSPIIAFSIMAATVSPSLVLARPNSPAPNGISHPRITEVETNGASNPLQLERRFGNALGIMPGNNLDALNPGTLLSSAQPASQDNSGSSAAAKTDAVQSDLPTVEKDVQSPKSAVANSAAPIAPAEPASPYAGGNVDATSSKANWESMFANDDTMTKLAQSGNKANIASEA